MTEEVEATKAKADLTQREVRALRKQIDRVTDAIMKDVARLETENIQLRERVAALEASSIEDLKKV